MNDDPTRTRFLGAIVAQLPADRVIELHLFTPIRQGGQESGLAVVAVDHSDAPVGETKVPSCALRETDGWSAAGRLAPRRPEQLEMASDSVDTLLEESAAAPRYTVYTARYRHTLKGPERGKWEASVTEEADAPLLTIDAVVRGVSRRTGELDETVRVSGEELRAAVAPVASTSPE